MTSKNPQVQVHRSSFTKIKLLP